MICDFFQIGSGISYYLSAINSDKLTENQVWNSVSNLFAAVDLNSINLNNNKISFIDGLCYTASSNDLKRLICIEKLYLSSNEDLESHLNLVIIIYQAIIKKFEDEISQCNNPKFLSILMTEKNIFISKYYRPMIIRKEKKDLYNDYLNGKISEHDYFSKFQLLRDLESLYSINADMYEVLSNKKETISTNSPLYIKFCELVIRIETRIINKCLDNKQIDYEEWLNRVINLNNNKTISFPIVYTIGSSPTRQ